MATRELIFDILAIDRASAVFDRVGRKADESGNLIGKAFLGAGVVLGVMAVEAIKTAGDMEAKMTKLTSTAGETASGMQVAWNGIDQMAGQVGYSVTSLGDAMYYVESGGFHAADGLKVLRAAAEGAKVENADVGLVAHTVTGALKDYGLSAKDATMVVNAMNTAVGHGLMTFNDLADAFPHVGARAKAANITLAETVSALGRMTADGLPASVAATYLGQTIGQLAAPTAKARTEMKGLGINATELSQTLTSGSGHGLGDAIKMIYDGIANHLTPAGLVAVDTFKKSKGSATDFQKVLANLPPNLQTNVQALATMAGGVKGFQGLIMLGQDGLKGYNGTLKDVNASIKRGGDSVDGFAKQQATFNGKVDDAKGSLSALKDALGRALLPAATVFMGWVSTAAQWLEGRALPAVMKFAGVLKVDLANAVSWVNHWIHDHQQLLSAIAGYITGTVIPVIVNFAKSLWDGLVGAFNTVKGAILDHRQQLETIGKALAVVGGFIVQYVVPILGTVLKYAFEAVGLAIAGVIVIVSDMVTWLQTLGRWGQWLWDNALKPAVTAILLGFNAIAVSVGAVLTALSHVPGFGWAKDAATAMDVAANAALSLATQINSVPRTITVTAQVDTTQAYSAIANLQRAAATGVNVNAKLAAQDKATGHNAVGTNFYRGGATVVGENGPEVVNLPRGASVTNNNDARSKGMLSGGGSGSGPTLHIENYYAGTASAPAIASEFAFRLRTA